MTHIYYINLDRVPQRAEFMETQLRAVGLIDCTERVSAVDAAAEGSIEDSGYAPYEWRSRWTVARSLVCAFMSHQKVWQKIVDEQITSAVVMEDDLLFSTEFSDALRVLESEQHDFDVVKLDGADQVRRYGPVFEVGALRLRPILQEVLSAAAYLLTLEGAQRLLELSQRFADHIDDFIFRPRDSWRAYQLFPSVAVQAMFCDPQTTADFSWLVAKSERSSDRALNTGVEKGPFSYRASREIVRSLSKAEDAIWGDRVLLRSGGFIGRPTLAEDLGPYRSRGRR